MWKKHLLLLLFLFPWNQTETSMFPAHRNSCILISIWSWALGKKLLFKKKCSDVKVQNKIHFWQWFIENWEQIQTWSQHKTVPTAQAKVVSNMELFLHQIKRIKFRYGGSTVRTSRSSSNSSWICKTGGWSPCIRI